MTWIAPSAPMEAEAEAGLTAELGSATEHPHVACLCVARHVSHALPEASDLASDQANDNVQRGERERDSSAGRGRETVREQRELHRLVVLCLYVRSQSGTVNL